MMQMLAVQSGAAYGWTGLACLKAFIPERHV